MEVICDDTLWIWHVIFGIPSSKNDVNILNLSPLFNSIRVGSFPPAKPKIKLLGLELDWYYYMTDGIYPPYRIFLRTIREPRTAKEKYFSKCQEGARKAVERVFGVLFQMFNILYQPSRLWYVEDMNNVVKACIIIHNMICEERRESYTGTINVGVNNPTSSASELIPYKSVQSENEQVAHWRDCVDHIENSHHHTKLQQSLCDHLWNRRALLDEWLDLPKLNLSKSGN
jgi:Plant transposon protein